MKISVDSFKEYLLPTHPNIIIKEGFCAEEGIKCFYRPHLPCNLKEPCKLTSKNKHYEYKPSILILLKEL
jgi:hypothetical protein